jgi:glycogen operon protein
MRPGLFMNKVKDKRLARAAATLRRAPVLEGKPFPLGAIWDGLGVNFALFSAHATKVELCLFDDSGKKEIERIELPEYTDEVWHGYIPTHVRVQSTPTGSTAITSQMPDTVSIPTSS